MIESYRSSYRDAIILSSLFITLGGCIVFSLYLANITLVAIILLLFITYQCVNFFKTTYDYNNSLEEKKDLFIVSDVLNTMQKHWFLIKMEEELMKTKKPIFWDQENASKVYVYFRDKINNNESLTEDEQYVLNLFLIDYLDLDQIARNWIIIPD
ncbi:hypothetical protein CIB95_04380 [Lottiidibacillus patelloidae]|uniref:Uncharacterized protein n=1 Tax=Lottiidibacillus patelloidae TaxID=2670334 RepID=A0A263BV63_9BACI|nr:hypothetical protein [Lottiidibacillus patelloidae]OZM57614.1 hypothetical protein CIB95_04380 [Lottiidibacillus patelloidae]